jgi:hypothetical protein
MPFTGGSLNWGGVAIDGGKGAVYVNSSNLGAGSRFSRPTTTQR